MEREPKQARSVASTNRMLDAAEHLLSVGGPGALTVEAVVRESQSSTGSFYARFGGRQGLMVALQDRFLERLGSSLADTFESLPDEADLGQTIRQLVRGFLDAFRTHRSAFVAFMLTNRSEDSMRERGARASRDAATVISEVLGRHPAEIGHPDPRLAADVAYRALFAVATQTVMFDDHEVTPRPYGTGTLEQETARMLLSYLRRPEPPLAD
jgi:AcrR family transcriptional regulator